jgi:hypothetical protein
VRQDQRVGTAGLGLQAAVAALRSPALAGIVDLVAWPEVGRDGGPRAVNVANAHGHVLLTAADPDGVLVSGEPLWDGPPDSQAQLPQRRNSYPLPWPRLSSFFADPRSPDVAIVHTGAHYFPERGGHLGEHGSLSLVQSCAPFLLSGAGVRETGLLQRQARLVDVMPTLAWVAGVDRSELAGLDGVVRDDLVTRGAAHIVGLLWDGAHPDSLLQWAQEGLLPNVSRLLDRGCWLTGGAVAEFPSLTLVNHTSALTGVGPGRHGVVGNVYYDREQGRRVVPNDPATWHRTGELYRDGVATLFEVVGRAVPGAITASVCEMTDRGATESTFALVRAALVQDPAALGSGSRAFVTTVRALLPDPLGSPYVTAGRCEQDDDYAFFSAIDLLGLATVLGLWSAEAVAAGTAPLVTWWSSYTTDAAHHAGGPYSDLAADAFRDNDNRLGVLLDRLQDAGTLDDTLILLTADHGFESADRSCRGDWAPALHEALDPLGVPWRDEGPGFLYLGVAP